MLRWFALALIASAGAACADSLAPTPESDLVTVTTKGDPFVIRPLGEYGHQMSVSFGVTNNSGQTVFSNLGCAFVLQHAEGGKRRDEICPGCDAIRVPLAIIAPRTSAFAIVGLNSVSQYGPIDFIPEGTYRIRVSLFFDRDGKVPLPDDAGYSRPLRVTSNDHPLVNLP